MARGGPGKLALTEEERWKATGLFGNYETWGPMPREVAKLQSYSEIRFSGTMLLQ